MHRVRLGLRKQEKKAKHAIEVFDGATHLSYFGAFAIQEELPAKVFDGATHLSYFGAFAIQEELPAKAKGARVAKDTLDIVHGHRFVITRDTYTSISSHGDPLAWAVDFFRFQEPDSLEAAPTSPEYVPGPEEPKQAPLSPDYMPGPEYPEYLAPSNGEVPVEDQPYAVADSSIDLSLGYVADSDPEEYPEEDSEDGPVDYPADGGDGNDDDSSDDDEEEEEALEEEEDEHLASADSVVAPVVDHVPSSEETEPFEADVILVSTPMDTCEKLMPNNGQSVSQLKYSRVIGSLMYAMTCTRPDIAFAMVLEGYIDASWISNTKDNSSTSGWVFLLAAGKEAERLKNLLLEIPLWSKPIAPISIRCDSAATLAKAYSQMYNGKSRHLGVRHSMIRELITNGVISIEFVRSQQNLADHLTKELARDLVIKSAEGWD
ncbi:hypothetical protein Tco_1391905 [Tanacetum coccineum]